MKKKKPEKNAGKTKRYNGVFDYKLENTRLDPEIVSSTEMTGMIPAADDEYDYDVFEDEE